MAYISVEIRDLSGGTPGSLILASRSLPASSVPTNAGFVPVNFAPPAPVVAGTQYAIVAYSSAATSSYLWFVSPSDAYAGGNPLVSTSPPTTWTPIPVDDQVFKTYVVPSTAAPGPTGQRAAALKKCKRSHSKKKRKKCRKKANRLPV